MRCGSKAGRSRLFVLIVALAAVTQAHAFEPSGAKRIVAHMHDGKDVHVGTVTFTSKGDGATYRLEHGHEALQGVLPVDAAVQVPRWFGRVWCYVPYPYDHPHVVTAKDYSWLEHDLLFFWKTPTSYGAKMDNGLIYDFKPVGAALVGKPQAIGLEKIASPQDDPKVPPYQAADRDNVGGRQPHGREPPHRVAKAAWSG